MNLIDLDNSDWNHRRRIALQAMICLTDGTAWSSGLLQHVTKPLLNALFVVEGVLTFQNLNGNRWLATRRVDAGPEERTLAVSM
jgi:hypothetical protein